MPIFNALSAPTVSPELFLIFIGTRLLVSLSALKKFAAGTFSAPTTNASAFSAVPRYFPTPEPVISNVLKLYPGLIVVKPCNVVFGVNASVAIIAKVFALTSTIRTVYVILSVPIIVSGLTPVERPSLNVGPTKIQPEPVNKYNCWLSVSTHKSPTTDWFASGCVVAFLSPLALTQLVPSYNFS